MRSVLGYSCIWKLSRNWKAFAGATRGLCDRSDQKHHRSCLVKKSDTLKHSVSFSCVVIATWLPLRYTQCKASPTAAAPSRDTRWYRKSCCVNGATGLPNDVIWEVTAMKCAKLINTVEHLSACTWPRIARSGWRQRGPFIKFTTVFTTSYPQLKAPHCARYTPGEVNVDSAEYFYSRRPDKHM